jgi:TonB family protein
MNERGKVYLNFVIEQDGKITHVAISKGVSFDIDQEAKRVLRAMPNWIPGKFLDEKVRTKASIPIEFTLY